MHVHISLFETKFIIFLSIFHLELCALAISTRWNRTSMLFDFPYIVICCSHYWPYMADNRATSLLSVLSYQYSFFVGSVVMMTCFWTKHHPISQLVTYFFTCFLLLFLLSFAQLNFSQNCLIFIDLCAGNVLWRYRCILENCLVRCHSLFCNRKRLVATIISAGHTRWIIDFAHKLGMGFGERLVLFFQCCRMSTQLIDWLV